MKVIFEENSHTIHVSQVRKNHIIVAIIEGQPCILGKNYKNSMSDLAFFIIKEKLGQENITIGNSYNLGDSDSIEQMIIDVSKLFPQSKCEVFEQKDWKEALQWLIDNA